MDSLSKDYREVLLAMHEPVCLSLYQPTHRHYPDNQQDPIRFRNLVKKLEDSLRQKYPAQEIEPLLDPFHALGRNSSFWNGSLDGLAVLGAPGLFRVYRLQRPVPELAVAAGSFHTKPLMRIVQSADRYQVLGLSRQRIKLYEGNRDALDEIEPAQGVPRTITDALGEELTEPHSTVASYGMNASTTSQAMHHGHGGRKDQLDIDTERVFRVVDRAILDHHSKPSGLPLMLAALPEYHGLFHQISHNPFRMEQGMKINPEALTPEELRKRAWEVMEPEYLARLARLIDEFGAARSREFGSDQVPQVAEAAVAGRIGTLLVEAEREVPGRIDPDTGQVEFLDLAHPEVDDLLDDLGELVLRKGGKVVIVPAERMPTKTGIAAIYRF